MGDNLIECKSCHNNHAVNTTHCYIENDCIKFKIPNDCPCLKCSIVLTCRTICDDRRRYPQEHFIKYAKAYDIHLGLRL